MRNGEIVLSDTMSKTCRVFVHVRSGLLGVDFAVLHHEPVLSSPPPIPPPFCCRTRREIVGFLFVCPVPLLRDNARRLAYINQFCGPLPSCEGAATRSGSRTSKQLARWLELDEHDRGNKAGNVKLPGLTSQIFCTGPSLITTSKPPNPHPVWVP